MPRLDLQAALRRLALNATQGPGVTAAPKPKKDEPTDSGFNEKNKDIEEVGQEKKPNPLATDKKAVVPKKGEEKKAPAKAAEPKEKTDGTLHCPKCGSAGPWTILDMSLRVHNVPASKLSTDSNDCEYDDSQGESEGWDAVQDGQVKCDKCETEYDYNDLVALTEGKAGTVPAGGGAPVAGLEGKKKPTVTVRAGEDEDSSRFVMVNIDVEVRPVTDAQVEAWEELRPGTGMGEDLLMQLSQATSEQDNIHFVEAQVSDDEGNLN